MEEALKLENYTYEDYLDIDKSTKERVELIFGKIYMMAGASALHQDIVGNIFFSIKSISKKDKKCTPRVAPFDLKLEVENKINIVQPDIMLFCDGDDLPCAVFEVLSPSTAYKDKTVKKELYEKSGIKEYFLVNSDYKLIEKFMIIEDKYQYIGVFGEKDNLRIDCLNCDISLEEIFEI
ncbi:MAG: Uma2 family endonuclease [Epsilonproteobacteria bacterium]|nr:Uma2 family endonuclease [Campylobacterota bacterium]